MLDIIHDVLGPQLEYPPYTQQWESLDKNNDATTG